MLEPGTDQGPRGVGERQDAGVTLEHGFEPAILVSLQRIPGASLHEGQRLLMRIISIEADKQRLGLSLKDVSQEDLPPLPVSEEEADAEAVIDEEPEFETEPKLEAEVAVIDHGEPAVDPVE